MKKPVLILLLFFSFVLTVHSQNSIPNAGFETWTNVGTFEEPDGWVTSNVFIAFFGGDTVNVVKTTDAYAGTYAIKLESFVIQDSFGYQQYGGIALSTDIATLFSSNAPGFPYSGRPTKLKGFYKSFSSVQDTSSIGIVLTQWNETDSMSSAIGVGLIEFTDTSDTYQPFEVPIVYSMSGNSDTVMIFFTSSGDSIINGGTLIVDELELEESTGISIPLEQLMDKGAYPNPATDQVVIQYRLPDDSDVSIEIYDVMGKLVLSYDEGKKKAGLQSRKIPVDTLDPGMYIYYVQAGAKRVGNKFIVQ